VRARTSDSLTLTRARAHTHTHKQRNLSPEHNLSLARSRRGPSPCKHSVRTWRHALGLHPHDDGLKRPSVLRNVAQRLLKDCPVLRSSISQRPAPLRRAAKQQNCTESLSTHRSRAVPFQPAQRAIVAAVASLRPTLRAAPCRWAAC
jgi:hypothetical protein